MSGEHPEREKVIRLVAKQPIAVGPKKPTPARSIVMVMHEGDAEPQEWGHGDPLPITGSASFGTTTVTITVNIPYEASRSNFNLTTVQDSPNPPPTTTTTAVASSAGPPAGNQMGSTVAYTANKALTIQLTFVRNGAQAGPYSYTIPAASVSSGANPSGFVLA